jgi:hypothetical protein
MHMPIYLQQTQAFTCKVDPVLISRVPHHASCMYIYIFIHIHTCIHTYVHAYTYLQQAQAPCMDCNPRVYNPCNSSCTEIHIYIYTHTYVRTYIHTRMYIFAASSGTLHGTLIPGCMTCVWLRLTRTCQSHLTSFLCTTMACCWSRMAPVLW